MLSQADKLIVDRYLDNSLTGIELRDFLIRLEEDEHFKKEVSFHNRLVEGIIAAENRRLALYVHESTGYRKRLIPYSLTLILTFLFVTFAGIILWEYIGPGSSESRHYFSWNFLKYRNGPAATPPATAKTEVATPGEEITGKPIDEKIDSVPAQDIVVKKDQLLVTYELQPIKLNVGNDSTDASEDQSSERTTDRSKMKFDVEFWVSPVNYKGYKLAGNKLILFGIELPDQIQLYAVDQTLWLKYGHDFYQLENSENFESLIAANDIPSQLR